MSFEYGVLVQDPEEIARVREVCCDGGLNPGQIDAVCRVVAVTQILDRAINAARREGIPVAFTTINAGAGVAVEFSVPPTKARGRQVR